MALTDGGHECLIGGRGEEINMHTVTLRRRMGSGWGELDNRTNDRHWATAETVHTMRTSSQAWDTYRLLPKRPPTTTVSRPTRRERLPSGAFAVTLATEPVMKLCSCR